MDIGLSISILAETPPAGPNNTTSYISWALGIPVTIIASAVTVYGVRGTKKRENRKLDLEILEKERALGLAAKTQTPVEVVRTVTQPIIETRAGQDMILRFVLLWLLYQAWGIVAGLMSSGLETAIVGLQHAVRQGGSVWSVIGFILVSLIASIPQIVQSLLFVVIGWPLLLDIAKLLRFQLPPFFYRRAVRNVLIVIAVISALMDNLVTAGITLFHL